MDFGPPEESPLNNRDYTKMQDALVNLAKAKRKIDFAKEAGIDCEQKDAECEYLQQRLEQMKSKYFPHKP
jgi:hypothetical protein